MANALDSIRHVVVLMLENRSFDHMLGYYTNPTQPIRGISNQSNLLDPANAASQSYPATKNAAYQGFSGDPYHDYVNVNIQLFGNEQGTQGPASNIGFVKSYNKTFQGKPNPPVGEVMDCFDPAKLPVLTTLASEFAVSDAWYSSVPGPTWPNRFFVHAASSGGYLDNEIRSYPIRTIYEQLSEAGKTWKIYYHDIPQALALSNLRSSFFSSRVIKFNNFISDARAGRLPNYSFIEPRFFDFLGWKANDQHPPHDVGLGENLIADVYEAMVKSKQWNESLLIILYDEHGGIYDSIFPPPATPPGDGVHDAFKFDRLGLRVPAVIVSPWITKGSMLRPPSLTSGPQLDHTSVIATVRKIFSLPQPLNPRDGSAYPIDSILDLSAPRTDAPRKLTRPKHVATFAAPRMTTETLTSSARAAAPSQAPLSEFQKSLVDLAKTLDTGEHPAVRMLEVARPIDNEHDAALFVREKTERFLAR